MRWQHDGLWDRDASFQPVPWLAESWDTSPDSTIWTFHLRPGLTFSDGSPLTSTDVQASFTYLATGKLVKVHAERTIDEVWSEISDVLEQLQARA